MPIPNSPVFNADHPLAQGLVALYLPGVTLNDFTGNGAQLTRSPNSEDGTNADGAAVFSRQENSRLFTKTLPAALKLTNEGTLYWRGSLEAKPLANTSFLGLNLDNNNQSPYFYYSMHVNNAQQFAFFYSNQNGGQYPGGTEIDLNTKSVAASFKVGGAIKGFVNGQPRFNTNWDGNTPPAYTAPTSLDIGGAVPSNVRRLNGGTNLVGIWNRVLSEAELASFDADPYQIFTSLPSVLLKSRVVVSIPALGYRQSFSMILPLGGTPDEFVMDENGNAVLDSNGQMIYT